MKNNIPTPPRAEDIEPYDSDRSVVRLFDEKGNWHAGIVCHIILGGNECEINVRQEIRFRHPIKRDPLDVTDTIITENDAPIRGSLKEAVAFTLKNPLVVDSKGIPGVLIIKSENTTTVLSLRMPDMQSVKRLLECKPRKNQ